jgi:hypothetical protein
MRDAETLLKLVSSEIPEFFPDFAQPELLSEMRVPLQLHGINPRTILGQVWWDIERKKAYQKYNRCCYACGTYHPESGGLHAHESYDYKKREAKWTISFTGYVYLKAIVALCIPCHNFIHNGRLCALVDEGKMNKQNAINTMLRGFNICRINNVRMKNDHLYAIKHLTGKDIDDLEKEYGKFKRETKIFCHPPLWILVINGQEYTSS